MHLGGTALIQKLGGFAHLRPAHNRVVDQQQALPFDQIMHRNQLHFGNQVSLALMSRHKGARPRRGVFDKRPGKRNTRLVGVSDRVGSAGIGHTGHNIRMHIIPPGQKTPAVIAHFFHTDPLVGRGGIAIVHPQEGADFHLFARGHQGFYPFRRQDRNLAGAQLPVIAIPQIEIGKALKTGAIALLLLAQNNGGTSQLVAGGIHAAGRQDQHAEGSLDQLLCIADSLNKILLLVDNGGHQLGGVDFAVLHFKKVGISADDGIHNAAGVVDLSHRGNSKSTVMGTNQNRLRFIIRDTANPQRTVHTV